MGKCVLKNQTHKMPASVQRSASCLQGRSKESPERESSTQGKGILDKHSRNEFKDVSEARRFIWGSKGYTLGEICSHLESERVLGSGLFF